jgi:predicted transcriptional regulator
MKMTLRKILEITEAQLLTPYTDLDIEATFAFSADLMSDVLHLATARALLITGLTHPQVVRTAEMAEIAAILFVRNKVPPPETLQLAEAKGVPILATKYTMFETSGRLYAAGMDSCDAPRSPQ